MKRLTVFAGMFIGMLSTTVMAASESDGHGESMTHKMMLLAVQLGLILFAAKIGNLIFTKMKMPGVLGELTAGIVIGPFALGHLALPGFAHGLFPMAGELGAISPELYGFGAVAAIILLFDVGLETDLKLLLRYSFAGTLVGVGGVAVSFVLGAALTSYMSPMILGSQLPFFNPICLFMGVISTATSVGITARVLSERKQLDSPEGVTILSAAVIDDVIGIILLAVVLGIVASTAGGSGSVDWGQISIIGAKAMGVWLVSTAIGIIASRRISFLLKLFRDKTAIAIMAFGLALILAGLFEQAKLAMIIGAYVMGVSLSQSDISHLVREKIHPLYAFFVPIFFCITGMLINLEALMSKPVLIFGAAFTVVGVLAKVLGCGIPALFANFNVLGGLRIGTGMVPRGEVGLIMAGIGLNAKLMVDASGQYSGLPDQLFASVIVMIMACTILAPLGLIQLFNNDKKGTRKDLGRGDDEETIAFDMPSIHMAEFFIQKLLLEFEGEGFFCHQLDYQKRLHQLRKDESVIDFHLDDNILTFSCNSADSPMVRGAMLEATAAMEEALRGLKEPLDPKRIGSGMLKSKEAESRQFNLGQFLTVGHIVPELKSTTKDEVIAELLRCLHEQGCIQDFDAAKSAVWERERKMTTGLEAGIAIPHGKSDSVDRLVCAVGICRKGIDFDSLDGELARIFVITLSPISKPAPHIQFMSTVSQLLDEAGRMYLLDERTPQEILEYMTGKDKKASMLGRSLKTTVTFNPAHFLDARHMSLSLKGHTPEEVIHELLELLESTGRIQNVGEAAKCVLERERQLSTAMEEGIALPHARTELVSELTCAVGVNADGVDFDGDGVAETKIVILVLTPISDGKPYMQFVASILKSLNKGGNERILAARGTGEMVEILSRPQN